MKEDNIPAFPTPDLDEIYAGMTLRDYFAAKAMQSILMASMNSDKGAKALLYASEGADANESIATASYELADYMLKERKKNKPQ